MARTLDQLAPAEILALAVSSEEEDAKIYRSFAARLRGAYPATAKLLDAMADEEAAHRDRLLDSYKARFGPELPFITRRDVRGFPSRKPIWLAPDLRPEAVRERVREMETEAHAFYERAAASARDVDVKKLLTELAEAEAGHTTFALAREEGFDAATRDTEAAEARRSFVLQIVQPGLAGLIDGSVSTLAPIFAAAFATQRPWDAFLVGLAASIGAGISMGLTEALSDDGIITGRGHPWLRGVVCGVMTAVGGLGHTLPFLIPDFWTANLVAGIVVAFELAAIAWIRTRYMETPFTSAITQIVLGGILVVLVGIFIGAS